MTPPFRYSQENNLQNFSDDITKLLRLFYKNILAGDFLPGDAESLPARVLLKIKEIRASDIAAESKFAIFFSLFTAPYTTKYLCPEARDFIFTYLNNYLAPVFPESLNTIPLTNEKIERTFTKQTAPINLNLTFAPPAPPIIERFTSTLPVHLALLVFRPQDYLGYLSSKFNPTSKESILAIIKSLRSATFLKWTNKQPHPDVLLSFFTQYLQKNYDPRVFDFLFEPLENTSTRPFVLEFLEETCCDSNKFIAMFKTLPRHLQIKYIFSSSHSIGVDDENGTKRKTLFAAFREAPEDCFSEQVVKRFSQTDIVHQLAYPLFRHLPYNDQSCFIHALQPTSPAPTYEQMLSQTVELHLLQPLHRLLQSNPENARAIAALMLQFTMRVLQHKLLSPKKFYDTFATSLIAPLTSQHTDLIKREIQQLSREDKATSSQLAGVMAAMFATEATVDEPEFKDTLLLCCNDPEVTEVFNSNTTVYPHTKKKLVRPNNQQQQENTLKLLNYLFNRAQKDPNNFSDEELLKRVNDFLAVIELLTPPVDYFIKPAALATNLRSHLVAAEDNFGGRGRTHEYLEHLKALCCATTPEASASSKAKAKKPSIDENSTETLYTNIIFGLKKFYQQLSEQPAQQVPPKAYMVLHRLGQLINKGVPANIQPDETLVSKLRKGKQTKNDDGAWGYNKHFPFAVASAPSKELLEQSASSASQGASSDLTFPNAAKDLIKYRDSNNAEQEGTLIKSKLSQLAKKGYSLELITNFAKFCGLAFDSSIEGDEVIILDPVMVNGHIFERSNLLTWMAGGGKQKDGTGYSNPITRETFKIEDVILARAYINSVTTFLDNLIHNPAMLSLIQQDATLVATALPPAAVEASAPPAAPVDHGATSFAQASAPPAPAGEVNYRQLLDNLQRETSLYPSSSS